MKKNLVDSGQCDQPEPVFRQRLRGQGGAHGSHALVTPGRVIIGTLAFACLVTSVSVFLLGSGTSYASVAYPRVPLALTQVPPTQVPPTQVPPTQVPPTQVPPTQVPPTQVPPTQVPTKVPTAKPTQAPTKAPTAKPTVPPVYVPPAATVPPAAGVSPTVTTAPSPTATADNSTPVAGTPTATPTPVPVPTLTAATPTPGSAPRVAIIVGSVFLVLLVGLGAGWFYFRRMLMPQGANDPNLPPSGARPWARDYASGPDGMGNAQGATMMMNGGMDNNGYGPGNYDPGLYPGAGPMNGMPGSGPGGYGSPDMNGNGYGGYSDGFIPPSPQIFPQGDYNMLPPGSGAFPQMVDANGFAPASQDFNAMYGMPQSPFPPSQGGYSGNPPSQGGYSGNGYGGPPPNGNGYSGPPSNGGNFPPGQVDLNDPYLADVIRQYSQKGQGDPYQQQQMPPNQQGSDPGYQQGPGQGPFQA